MMGAHDGCYYSGSSPSSWVPGSALARRPGMTTKKLKSISHIGERLTNILPFQVRIISQDFIPGKALRHQRYDQPHGYAHAADTSAPARLARFESYPIKGDPDRFGFFGLVLRCHASS